MRHEMFESMAFPSLEQSMGPLYRTNYEMHDVQDGQSRSTSCHNKETSFVVRVGWQEKDPFSTEAKPEEVVGNDPSSLDDKKAWRGFAKSQ
jgi:hypothetical protein